jgi:hypothetical protein
MAVRTPRVAGLQDEPLIYRSLDKHPNLALQKNHRRCGIGSRPRPSPLGDVGLARALAPRPSAMWDWLAPLAPRPSAMWDVGLARAPLAPRPSEITTKRQITLRLANRLEWKKGFNLKKQCIRYPTEIAVRTPRVAGLQDEP